MVFFVWDSEYPNKHLLVYGKEFSKIKTWDNDQPRKPPPRGGPGNTLLSFNHLLKAGPLPRYKQWKFTKMTAFQSNQKRKIEIDLDFP